MYAQKGGVRKKVCMCSVGGGKMLEMFAYILYEWPHIYYHRLQRFVLGALL